MILKDFENMERLLNEFDQYKNKLKIESLEKNNKLKRFQKLCRQKIVKFYNFISSLLSAKLKGQKDKN